MQIIEIIALENGAHRNQSGSFSAVPDGWAVIPAELVELKNFPFGEVEAAEIAGVMTVIKWTPGVMLEPEPEPTPEPTEADDTASMLVDHEFRLTLLELGLTEY